MRGALLVAPHGMHCVGGKVLQLDAFLSHAPDLDRASIPESYFGQRITYRSKSVDLVDESVDHCGRLVLVRFKFGVDILDLALGSRQDPLNFVECARCDILVEVLRPSQCPCNCKCMTQSLYSAQQRNMPSGPLLTSPGMPNIRCQQHKDIVQGTSGARSDVLVKVLRTSMSLQWQVQCSKGRNILSRGGMRCHHMLSIQHQRHSSGPPGTWGVSRGRPLHLGIETVRPTPGIASGADEGGEREPSCCNVLAVWAGKASVRATHTQSIANLPSAWSSQNNCLA